MLNPHPFKCDVCGADKQASNNWLIGSATSVTLTTEIGEECALGTKHVQSVVVSQWDDELALSRHAHPVVHLCGIECAAKWSTKEFDKLKK